MKKIICVLLVLIMLGTMVGCSGNKRFDSESALMEHLDGMWVVDSAYEDKTYYIFQDGKVFSFNDAEFSYRIEDYFDSFVSGDNLFALSKLDYEATIGGMGIEKIIGNAEENVVIQPSKGKIIIDQGRTYEKNIIVTDETVSVKKANEDEGTLLTKLSDVADFSGEYFKEIFEEIKKNYAIPMHTFLKTPAEYAELYIDGLILEKQITETSYKLYHMNGRENGAFAWDNTAFLYTTGKEASSDGNPTFQLLYKPTGDSNQFVLSEKLFPDLEHLIDEYAMPILSDIPWAIGTEKIMARFEQKAKTTNGVRSCSFVENDIEYGITIDYNKYIPSLDKSIPFYEFPQAVMITVSFNSSIDLSSIDVDALVSLSQYCSQCGKRAPDVIFSENWQPGDICFGCSRDNFHGGEDGKKYCSQCGADCTYRGLEEDGRCEDCYFGDSNPSNGNSGSNTSGSTGSSTTVCSHTYSEATCTKPKTCTKCGAISGTALGHTYSNATCTTPQTCKTCGATAGSAAGHKWKSATCTHPETCSVCNYTQGDALGHNMGLTKCGRCDYADYSTIAKTYPNVTAYDSKTGQDLIVTDVSVSNSGVLSFTFNGKTYSITIKERTYDSMTYFDCYQDGSKLANAECRIGDASYYNMLHFEWNGIDGHRLYFCTGKQ